MKNYIKTMKSPAREQYWVDKGLKGTLVNPPTREQY